MARGGPGTSILVGAILGGVGGVFLFGVGPAYYAIGHSKEVTLSSVSALPPGTPFRCNVTAKDGVKSADGTSIAYEHAVIEHQQGTGKRRRRIVDQEDSTPENITVHDATGSITFPTDLIDDAYVDQVGPASPSSEDFKRAKGRLIPRLSSFANTPKERELVVHSLPAGKQLTLMARRAAADSPTPVNVISSGFLETQVVLTQESLDEVERHLLTLVLVTAGLVVVGVLLFLYGIFKFAVRRY